MTDYHILNCRTIGVEWSGLVSGGHTLFSRGGIYRFSITSAPLAIEGTSSKMGIQNMGCARGLGYDYTLRVPQMMLSCKKTENRCYKDHELQLC